MSSTKNVLDFGLNFVSKTCLWGLTKLSLFDVMFLFQFWLKFGSILTALDTQNPDSMDSKPDKNGLRTLTESFFLHDIAPNPIFGWFWSLQDVSKTSPRRLKTPQDGSKTMSRRFQDGSRRLWTLPRRASTQSTFGKIHFSVDNAQWTDQSPQSIAHSSPFTVSYSHFIICKSEFLVQHLQFTVDHSHVTLLCPPHFTRSKIPTHKQNAPRSNSKV